MVDMVDIEVMELEDKVDNVYLMDNVHMWTCYISWVVSRRWT